MVGTDVVGVDVVDDVVEVEADGSPAVVVEPTDDPGMVDTVDGPVVEGPVVEDPVVEGPLVEDPVIEGPVIEGPLVEDPVVEGAGTEGPVIEESAIEGTATEGAPTGGRVVDGRGPAVGRVGSSEFFGLGTTGRDGEASRSGPLGETITESESPAAALTFTGSVIPLSPRGTARSPTTTATMVATPTA